MSVASVVLRSGVRDLARNRWVVAYAAGFFLVGLGVLVFLVRRPGTASAGQVRPLRTGTGG